MSEFEALENTCQQRTFRTMRVERGDKVSVSDVLCACS